MKKVIFILCAVLAVQLTMAQVSFGVQASSILAGQKATVPSTAWKAKAIVSWKAGGYADIPVASNFSVRPQLNILSKGGKWSYTDGADKIEYSERLTYLELPVYAYYNSGGVNEPGFFGGFGPVFSIGLGGKGTGTKSVNDPVFGNSTQNINYTVKFDGKEGKDEYAHYKGFEMGLGFTAGYKLASGVAFNFSYNLALTNIDIAPQATLKNNYLSLGIAYSFSK